MIQQKSIARVILVTMVPVVNTTAAQLIHVRTRELVLKNPKMEHSNPVRVPLVSMVHIVKNHVQLVAMVTTVQGSVIVMGVVVVMR